MGEQDTQPLLCSLPLWVVELWLMAESCRVVQVYRELHCKLFYTTPQLSATNTNSTTHNGSEHKRGCLLSTPIKSPWESWSPPHFKHKPRGFKLARPRCTILISSTKDIANMRPDTEETELTTQVAQYLTAITMKMITPVLSSTTSQKGIWYCALIQKHFLRCCSGPFSSWCCGACCPDPSCSWAASTCASAQSSCLSVTMATWGSSAVERQSQV